MGQLPYRQSYVSWYYPPLVNVMREAGLEELETYISRSQNPVAQYIATQTILDLCLEVEKHPRVWVAKWWWDQEGLSLEGAREDAEVGGMVEASG